MKFIYSILITALILLTTHTYAQLPVNYEVRVSELRAQGDNNDGGGFAGQQDPTWYVWAKDNSTVGYNADICQHTTNQWDAWWDLNDYTLITGSNSIATQITIEMECWENDCGGDCSYESSGGFLSACWVNPDDNYAARGIATAGLIDFRNDAACQWNSYDVYIDGNGSLPDYGLFFAKIEIKWEYANFSAGSDDTVCDSTLSLNAEGNGTWSVTSGSGGFFSDNSDPNSSFTGQPGQAYILTWQTLPGCINSTNSDNVNIEIFGLPDPMLVSSSDSICEGETVIFTAQNGTTYDWWVNSGGSIIQSGSGNTYTTSTLIQGDTVFVSLTDANNCVGIDYYTIDVSPIPILDLGNDTTICSGTPLIIDGTTPFVTYLWNNNETTSTIAVLDSGTYSLTVENAYGCTAFDDITINIFSTDTIDLGSDTIEINELDSLTLDAGNGFANYYWSDGTTTQINYITDYGEYWVYVMDTNGCFLTDTVVVIQMENNLFLPNMFTPNNDLQNDVLYIYGNGLDEEISFKIYNRWGKVVYETNLFSELQPPPPGSGPNGNGWDGKFNGIDQPTGVYLWTLIANDLNGNPVNFDLLDNLKSSGSILLKR